MPEIDRQSPAGPWGELLQKAPVTGDEVGIEDIAVYTAVTALEVGTKRKSAARKGVRGNTAGDNAVRVPRVPKVVSCTRKAERAVQNENVGLPDESRRAGSPGRKMQGVVRKLLTSDEPVLVLEIAVMIDRTNLRAQRLECRDQQAQQTNARQHGCALPW